MEKKDGVENVIIIWAGPAGHTAAIYTAQAMLEPLMFEWFMAGWMPAWGQLNTTTIVENFPWFPHGVNGPKLMDMMREQSINKGAKIITKTVDKVDLSQRPFKVFVGKDVYETKTLIVSTGAIAKRLGLPWEEKFWQRWVSACAVCDGGLPIFKNKDLAVIWWGDAAVEEALYLTNHASKVTLFVRRDELRASKYMQKKAKNHPKIEIMRNTEVRELLWDALLKSVKVENNKTWEISELEFAGLFYAIWHTPNTAFLEGQLELDDAWYLVTKSWTAETNVEGVFAAGDVQDRVYRQAVTSAGTWCMAALEVERYLQD